MLRLFSRSFFFALPFMTIHSLALVNTPPEVCRYEAYRQIAESAQSQGCTISPQLANLTVGDVEFPSDRHVLIEYTASMVCASGSVTSTPAYVMYDRENQSCR